MERRRRPRSETSAAKQGALRALADAGPLSLTELAARLHRDPSSVSVTVSALTDRGLVARRAAPDDHRRLVLSITAGGRRVLDRAHDGELAALEAALARRPGEYGRRLAAALTALADVLARGEPIPRRRPPA